MKVKYDLPKTRELLKPKAQKSKSQKVRTTFYLDKAVYDRFKVLCESRGTNASELVETIMQDLVGESNPGKLL